MSTIRSIPNKYSISLFSAFYRRTDDFSTPQSSSVEFVDPVNRDYRLKSESPAFRMGFEPIDMAAVGLEAGFGAGFGRD